jgi:FkbM family methyltransferase
MDIFNFIQQLPIQTFVEVGCHFGTDTEKFRKMHPQARIVCFEPDQRNLDMLKNRGVHAIAEIYPYALSNVSGMKDFYLSGGRVGDVDPNVDTLLKDHDWSCSSSLKRPTGHLQVHRWVNFNRKVPVNCIVLDEFQPLLNTVIDFMWVDVQGAEDLVFAGAKETLKRTKYVYTEYSNWQLYESQLNLSGVLQLFGPNWEVVHDFGGDVLLKNTQIGV